MGTELFIPIEQDCLSLVVALLPPLRTVVERELVRWRQCMSQLVVG
jgi:hypothetical protein